MRPTHYIRFKAEFAHFSVPALKAEGFTYPCPTPSALRGALESICYKPQVYVDVREIRILKPIRTQHYKVNGLKHRLTSSVAKDHTTVSTRNVPAVHQMNMVLLRDVEYVVGFELRLCTRKGGEVVEVDSPGNLEKYHSMYSRRIEKGQCFRQPYLGIEECQADFLPVPDPDHTPSAQGLKELTMDFGTVVHGIDYLKTGNIAYTFHAVARQGTVHVPSFADVLKER